MTDVPTHIVMDTHTGDVNEPVKMSILADGIEWEDSDGNTSWPRDEAATLAAELEQRGYEIELI